MSEPEHVGIIVARIMREMAETLAPLADQNHIPEIEIPQPRPMRQLRLIQGGKA